MSAIRSELQHVDLQEVQQQCARLDELGRFASQWADRLGRLVEENDKTELQTPSAIGKTLRESMVNSIVYNGERDMGGYRIPQCICML